jgi:hypothetical protein
MGGAMSDTPPRKNRRSFLDRTSTPALPRRDVTRPDPTIPGFEGVIPDGAEPAEPVALQRKPTADRPEVPAPRPTLLPVEASAEPDEVSSTDEAAPDDRARWALLALVVAVGLLLAGAVGGASVSGLGFALLGPDASPEAVLVPVGIPEPQEDIGAAEPEVPLAAEPASPPAEAPAEPDDAEAGEDEEKGLKIKLPKLKLGKKKQE